ncbi:Dynein heavy chain [Phytophthora megakarya]|uniref:Dynein heavy chain n=1 Tax=Phytophthora megakarya TaxID=4795 RepID=A0A225WXS6_9STRA|nr:Dynein heavy chain [Phytophthora megakarya]
MDPDVGDARRSYLIGLLRGLWAPRNTRLSADKNSQQALTQFLDELQCNVLHARLASGSEEISLTNTLQDEQSGNNDETAAFLKLQKAAPLTPENMSTSVQLTSALQTPLQSLYQTVHQVYAPLLLHDDVRASLLSQKLKDVLLELDAGLAGTVLMQGGSGSKKPKAASDESDGLMSIATMSDEFAYWEAMQDDSRQARRAKKFSAVAVFDTVHQRFSAPLGDLSFEDMGDLLDDASNVADDLWRLDLARDQMYPQRRMDHLLGLVTNAINAFVLAKAKTLSGSEKESEGNVWQAPFHAVHHLLQQGVALSEKWRSSIESLTGTLWPAHSEHAWEGSMSGQVQRVQLVSARLEQVLRVRTTYEELHALLPSRGGKNQDDELAESCFRPFERLRPLYYNAYTEPAWQRALSEFDRSLAPMETQVAVVLRERLRAVTSKPSAAARLLQRYQHLLQRPTLAQALAGERDALLAQLLAHVDQLDSDFETRKQNLGSSSAGSREKKSGMHVGKTLSSDVNVIVWAHALGRRVADMQRLARSVLTDLPALPRLSQQCDKLTAKASGLVLDRVRDWQENMLRALDEDGDNNGGQSLRLRGRLMQIDKQSGDLVVNFSEFLVTLLRDVRQLTELSSQQTSQTGDSWVPARVRQVAEEAEKYYRFGVTLQKVANFYNSIEAQIIDEQKPMLLDSLLAFEDAVQRPGIAQSQNQKTKSKDVTWANLDECDEYKVGEELLALMDVDLLRYPAKWKERWDEIKRGAQLTTRKQDSARTAKWFLYWDHQLYKVLESGYQLGLEMLNENLPEIKEIKTELHFPTASAALASSTSGGSILVLRPPVEELRTTYYKAMKKFVARPTKFGGFANSQVFSAMCDANARNLVRVYESCEKLFTRLEGLLFEYEHWGFLARIGGGGNVDLDVIMESTLQEPVDWEVNFKTIRTKRKESEKIPDAVKVDCINLSFVPFKRSLDDHLQRFTDALLLSLRKSTLNHIRIVEEFVDASMESLNKRPHSIDEISAAQLEWKDIDARKNDVQSHFQKADKKKMLLLAVLGGGSSAGMSGASLDTSEVEARLAQLPTRWENFEIALEAFNDMIEEQRESLKGEIEGQVVECNIDIDKFRERWTALRPVEVQSWEDDALVKIYTAMTDWRQRMDELKTRSVTLTSNCAAFSMPEPIFDGLSSLDDEVGKLQRNWDTYRQFREEIQAIAAQDWFAFCTNMFALPDTAQKWADALKEQAAHGTERTAVVDKINDFNTNVKRAMPTLKLCRGEPFKDDHWTQLFRKLGFPRGVEKQNLLVQHFMDVFPVLELPATLQFVKVLHARAQGEVTIRDALQELRAWTETAELALLIHEHDGRRVAIIKDWKDLTLALGDNQSLLASLKESQFFKPFEVEATSQYEIKMSTLDQVLTQLNLIQRKWVFLEPIFSKGALPSEQSRFRRVDEEFTDIMGAVERDPKLFNLADELMFPQLVDRLTTMVDQLERCQKALADFLEEKRSRMPRFYFIGDEDLLEILGQAQNPAVIQSHLKKLYQGVYRVEFSEQQDQIVAMLSSAGERVELHTSVAVTINVEEWLETFTDEMRRTIRVLTAQCVNANAPDYHAFPSQVLCLTEQIRFCSQAEAAIKNGGVQELKRTLQDTLRELTSLDLSTELLMSLKVKALVLDLVHHIDVCDQLLHANCRSVADWIWQKQLRFYLDTRKQSNKDSPPCLIRMNDAEFAYTYEYQGNAPKLVHTPLTDKCYLTLTQGMHMGFGGNPYGPAGTGKTESVKALGGQFGRQVLVFNCDEGIDFQSMGRIFIGLVKCGAWGCFDEFNRLKEDQLSAISQQIQVIQDAIKEKTGTINLLSRSVDVDFNAGIFVTLNPAGKGYGGRSKLPDNLKALFRPVAMGRPDNNLIAEVILYSEGFSEAKDIASKVVSLYSLSGQLLSRQQHYDWGLRALKAVLNTAGKLLQAEKKDRATNTGKMSSNADEESKAADKPARMTTAEETEILIKASADLAGGALGDAIREVMTNKPFFLQVDDLQIRKMLQLKESLDQRMGCVVLVKTHVMNPKSMPRERLLGHMDLDTREWEDGVLTAAARQVVKEPENVRSWIICDGDVDPEWIESLNSVLDDNHLLTLPNGERINFGPNVNFVFETHDLRFASPATISRMGMIFLSDEDIAIERLVSKWLLTLPPVSDPSTSNTRDALKQWIEELFTRGLEELHKYESIVATTTVGTIMNGLSSTFYTYETKRDTYGSLDGKMDRRDLVINGMDAVVPTVSVQRGLQVIEPWVDKMEPFILVGPEGSAKCKQIVQEIRHLKSGLSKLEEASVTVDELSRNAVLKKKDLSAAQVSADEAMKEITNALDRAATNRREVEDLKKQLAKAETATNARKREIEQELSEITPILQTAMEAVGNIKSDNLNEIRSLKMPPEPIHDVLSAVLMLLGIQDTSWNSMKKFLGNRGVKEDILNYDAHRITPEISKAVTKLVKSKTSSFDHETIYRVSVAAAPLATWVKANLKYSMVLNKIEPLETDLAEAKRSLEASQQRLLQCESELKKIDITVDQMKVQFGEKTKEAEILRVNLEQAQSTLNKAQGLLGKLGGEKHRWSEQVKELESRLTDLPVRMLLASAFTTFLGKCSEDARKRVVKEWERDILENTTSTGPAHSLHFDYRKLLSTESELLTWKGMGLPSDNLSMENALIVSNSSGERCPFIIDPASASTTWLQAELAKDTTRPLSIVQSQDTRFVNLVEQAVRFGKTLVILEVDNVEPYLYPLVRKDLIHQGPRFVVALGDKMIDYNENFRLYLVTRNPSPPLAPDALAIVNVVNFTVTKSGLEGQLLGVTIQHEQPELEQEKSELLRQEEECKVQLAALEKQLVEALATSEGDILENTILVESLTKTKATSAEIEHALERSAKKSEELDEKRETYAPFAREGAKMFFLVKQLSAVNHMYRFSLASFLGLFKATLATKMESSNTKDRILRLIPILEHKVLMFVGRALFKEHRPMFGMHLVHGMHPECFEKNEYEFFCGEVVEVEKASGGHNALPEWASPERKEAFTQFVEALPRLAQICKFESHDMWIRWSKSMECEQNFHPKMDKSGSAGGLSAFQKLLVVQALRPDRLQSAIIQFICGVMQLKSLTPPSLDFKVIGTEEATNTTPVLLLTTAGADPSKELEEVATSVVGKGHYFEVAMGGGQQEKALNLLKSTAEHGEWLCLQNLHLVIAWLPVLEKEFSALTASHKFRLWLTTEPHDAFPLVLLEQSLKITFESPPGMKKNLQRTYAAWNPAFIAKGSSARAQLLFLLAFFHALLQERRTYIPQGWTKFYEFSFGDFRAGSNVMELACQTSGGGSGAIDWQTLHGLMENAIYGGRIDNPYDLRVLRCNLAEYFSQELLSGQKSLTRGVKLPQSTQHTDFLDLIDRFPDIDTPAMFGLPDNIERSMQRSLSGQVISQLKALSSSEAEATAFDREKWRAQLGPLLETWGKLTTGFQLEGTSLISSAGKNLQVMSPADAFVALENDYALDLAQQVNSSLQALKKVIYGTGLLTPAIQNIAKALLKGIVPSEWAAQWEGNDNVGTWLRGLAMRKRALSEWQEAVGSGQLLSKGLDLSELLHPGTFLNALRQQSAREQKCSMDGMKLLSCWERERLSGTKVEWFELTRLLLQGASFEGGTLLEAVSDAQELVAVPSCYVAFVREDAQEIYEKETCIKTPLYYATDRERMLVEISMPISGDRARWVLAGVALFLGE